MERFDKLEHLIDGLAIMVKEGFDRAASELQEFKNEANQRFDNIETRLDGVEQRLDRVEFRLDKIEFRLDSFSNRLDIHDDRFRLISTKIGLA